MSACGTYKLHSSDFALLSMVVVVVVFVVVVAKVISSCSFYP